MNKKLRLYFFILIPACFFMRNISAQATDKPYIFFILTDDLNDYPLNVEGHPQAITPGMDAIAAAGTTFLNAQTSSPKCAPSRTSLMTGKDLAYTQVYYNPACMPFRDYFTPAKNNDEVFTIPEYLKTFGYYTYGINKIYHCFDTQSDFDSLHADPCEKELSWSKFSWFVHEEDTAVLHYGQEHNEGLGGLAWARIPDSMEYLTYDHRVVDSALLFIKGVQNGTINTCGDPFFIALGLRRPHVPWFVPEKYFSSDYVGDFYAEPFNYPYNDPYNQFPFNGVVMPPQPDTLYGDYFKLGMLGKAVADFETPMNEYDDEVDGYSPLPEFDPDYSDDERTQILNASLKAQTVIAYLAAVQFLDAQIKRLIDSVMAYPEIYNNSVFILVSDHGFSLGEKRNWNKDAMWETDLRVPFIIADMRNPASQITYSTASLLDLFPTICDLVDIPYPTFANGSAYLDGHSLMPLIINPASHIDRPALSAIQLTDHVQCSCFPQYSVRNNRYHYIYYTSNNTDTVLACNNSFSWHEDELYDIGDHLQTDPNEWNNLANDSTYDQVINYLQQWLPDSAMYMQTPFSVNIKSDPGSCFLGHDDMINLHFDLYDTTGILIAPPDSFIYRWTNNITTDVFTGTSALFPVALLSDVTFAENSSILFTLEMIAPGGNKIVGLDTHRWYINPANEPEITYDLITDTLTVRIENINLYGSWNSVTWDFGDGTIISDTAPAPHTYATGGTYLVTCTLRYGNASECIKTFQETVSPLSMPELTNTISVYPNPASGTVTINCSDCADAVYLKVIDLAGQTVMKVQSGGFTNYQLNTERLPAGYYIIEVTSSRSAYTTVFEKL